MLAALLAVAFQTVVGWIVSIRLLALARRTGALPERLLGASLLLSVAVGYPLRIAAPRIGSELVDWLGNACVSAGFALCVVFVQRVFRPEAAWARELAAALVFGFVVQSALAGVQLSFDPTLLQMGLAMITYGWGALEAGTRARMLGKQRALGLGDAAVHDRFRLFALLGTSVVLGALANAAAIVTGRVALEEPAVLIVTTLSGTTLATSTLLAFAPPRLYRRRFAAAQAA
jgi:hypothetical protein